MCYVVVAFVVEPLSGYLGKSSHIRGISWCNLSYWCQIYLR